MFPVAVRCHVCRSHLAVGNGRQDPVEMLLSVVALLLALAVLLVVLVMVSKLVSLTMLLAVVVLKTFIALTGMIGALLALLGCISIATRCMLIDVCFMLQRSTRF